MSKLEELLEDYCPDGVEFKKIGDLVLFLNGRAYKQSELLSEGKYKVVRVGNFFTNDSWYYSDLELEEEKYCNKGDLLYTWAASLGAFIWNGEKAIYHYHVWKLKFDETIINKKYLLYFLNYDVKRIQKSLTESTMPHISMANMKNREIPVPPLPVQEEIVRILDMFTGLTAELTDKLTAELTARKKQYEYYRDQMLASNFLKTLLNDNCANVQYKKLSEIGTLTRGKRFTKKDFVSIGTPAIHYGELYTHYGIAANETITFINNDIAPKMRYANPGDVIIVGAGETVEDVGIGVAWLGKTKVAVHDACYTFHHDMNSKFVSYYLRTHDYHKQISRLVSVGKICSISADSIGRALIPIPPLYVQEKIVSILDNFTKLTTEVSTGLPAEIEAREKQYEYYRDKLLTFKRKA